MRWLARWSKFIPRCVHTCARRRTSSCRCSEAILAQQSRCAPCNLSRRRLLNSVQLFFKILPVHIPSHRYTAPNAPRFAGGAGDAVLVLHSSDSSRGCAGLVTAAPATTPACRPAATGVSCCAPSSQPFLHTSLVRSSVLLSLLSHGGAVSHV